MTGEPREDKLYYADPQEVIIPEERVRWIFDKEKLKQLVDSIVDKGQLQPGVCRMEDGKPILIAGQRRLLACMEAKVPFFFVLNDETDPKRILEIELEENVHRVDLDWKEKASGVARLHTFLQERDGEARAGTSGGHGTRDTANFLGMSVGKVSEELELANYLDVPEVADAKNKTEAKKVIKRIREEYQTAVALKEARRRQGEETGLSPDGDWEMEGVGSTDQAPCGEAGERVGPADPREELYSRMSYYSDRIREGRMEDELEKIPDGTFDIVCFDPPWGVDYDSVGEFGGDKLIFGDDSNDVGRLLSWLRILFDKMASASHIYIFFGIVNYDYIYNTIHEVGFQTNGIPFIWWKQGMHRTRNPDIWPGRAYEPIAYARKGNKPLVWKGASDMIPTPAPFPTMKGSHPAAKHPKIYAELLKRSASPGDKVLDPMCGSGMFGVACEYLRPELQLEWLMIEQEPAFAELSIMNVTKGWHSIVDSSKGQRSEGPIPGEYALPPLPADFRELTPGTDGWRRYWGEHPEKQEEMLEWERSQG